MKVNEAPEKIYLEKVYPDNGILPNGLNYNQSPDDIEYIRTDAFINKATKWIIDNFPTVSGISAMMYAEDFKNAMKL